MKNSKTPTESIPKDSLRQKVLQSRRYITDGTASLKQKTVNVVIRGVMETLLLVPSVPLTIGRRVYDRKSEIDLDLSIYGAHRYGVSRMHAALQVNQTDKLYITDLDSTNGTYLNGERIPPHVPTLVRDGDKIILGNFLMRICFEAEPAHAYS